MSIFICPGCGRSCGKGITLQCTKCLEMFHPQCAGISPIEPKEKPNWICLICSNNDEVHESCISNNNPCISPIISSQKSIPANTNSVAENSCSRSVDLSIQSISRPNKHSTEIIASDNISDVTSQPVNACDFDKTFVSETGISHVVVNSILFFALDSLKAGISVDEISNAMAGFYRLEELNVAKTLLACLCRKAGRLQERRGKTAEKTTASDIMRVIIELDSKQFIWPVIVPRSFNECPVLKPDISVRLDKLVYDYSRKLDKTLSSIERIESNLEKKITPGNDLDLNPPTVPHHEWPPLPLKTVPLETIVIKNPPTLLLKDPVCRKKEFDKTGCANIRYVKATKDSVMVSVPCQDASKLSCDLKVNFPESIITSKPRRFFGIIRSVDIDFDVSAYALDFPGIIEFNRLGKSQTVRVIFQTEEYLHFYIKHGIKFGYEIFRLERDRIQPRRCFKCQSFNHVQNQCKSECFKCARCSGNHISTKDSPCQAPVKCASCGSNDHPVYSFRCPILKKFCK